LLCLGILAGAYAYLSSDERAQQRGRELNRTAWESSYLERGLVAPASGPRAGYWGKRLNPVVEAPAIGWHHQQQQIEGLLDVDAHGLQHYVGSADQTARVLILGGSVAFATYSSSTETTYFHLLGSGLEAAGAAAEIDVLAGAAWKAVQELRGLEQQVARYAPDVIVLLDGLNDLTVGATAEALFGERGATEDDSERDSQPNSGDYRSRVPNYLKSVRAASEIAAANGSALLVVLQPSLMERRPPSPQERKLIDGATATRPRLARVLRSGYEGMRKGLLALEREGALTFLDASRAFNEERHTTFADMWHFGDAGHAILAERMVVAIAAMLREAQPRTALRPS
jgi:lysophospholipase L1-like esterase